MNVPPEMLAPWLRALLDPASAEPLCLEDYLQAIPQLATLADLPAGTPVMVRGDVDAKPGPQVGDGDIRLRSMIPTLKFGQKRGWKQIIFGHIGRKPDGTLAKVAERISVLLGAPVTLVTNWWDETTECITDSAAEAVRSAAAGSVLVLENTRRYKVERLLWDATATDAPAIAALLARFANQISERIARVYVNEALSAGSLDSSTTVVPAAMDRVALGEYVAGEFDGPMRRCLATEL
ncbi:MAG TPA: phosphoglycerate kinase, partial [Pirellulales bacterium]